MRPDTPRTTWSSFPLRIVVPSLASFLLFTITVFGFFIPRFEASILESRREMIRDVTEVVWASLQVNYEEELSGRFSRAEAQERAIHRVRHLRYGQDGKDYFWINDMHPRMILHPYQPELEGEDLTDYADPEGHQLFKEGVRIADDKGEGYIEYLWQWKDDPNRVIPKLSFVKAFEPWGWVIGTGVYLEDVRAQTAQMSRSLIWVCLGILLFTGLLSGFIIHQGVRTERRRLAAEEERNRLAEQLHYAQKMEAVGQLAGGVAHDFNNLLTAILGNVNLLESSLPENERVQAALADLHEAVEQATAVTRSLLTFGREVPAEKKPIKLQEVIEKSNRILNRLLPASLELVVDAPPEPPLWVQGDMSQLQQVVLNLAINARDAMPDGGRLTITASAASAEQAGEISEVAPPDATFAALTIADTGEGIPAEIRGRLFEPFFSTKPRGQGTGLGLSVVHGIVQSHDGKIGFDTEPGRGTSFTVYLPCVAEDELPVGTELPAEVGRGSGETILVAEDNQFVRSSMASVLQLLGYEVIQATDGCSVLETRTTCAEDIALIILDVDLPGRRGDQCLGDIRREDSSTPVILITGSVNADLKDVVDHNTALLRKPFQMAQLGGLVSRLLKRPAVREASGD